MDKVNICVPLMNEEDTVPELYERLSAAADKIGARQSRFIFVDDGSTDSTRTRLLEIAARDSRATVVVLARNFGHQNALAAAFDQVKEGAVCVLDGDLQDEPEHLPHMVARLDDGIDVVYATRAQRDAPPLLNFAYRLFYRILSKTSDVPISPDAGDFCAMSQRAFAQMCRLQEFQPFHRGLRAWVGFKQEAYPVFRPRRKEGKTKYSLRKLLKLATTGVASFSTVPLRLILMAGLASVGMSALFAIYAIYEKLVHDNSPSGFTALLIAIVFLGGTQLICLGVIGQYIGMIFEQVKDRPRYIIESIRGGE